MTAALKDLRHILEVHFVAGRTVIMRLIETSVLPTGQRGRGGSAAITERQAALTLFGCAAGAWASPMDARDAALKLAGFLFHGRNGRGDLTLLDVFTGELKSIANGVANFEPANWVFGEVSVVRGGEPRLRFIAPNLPQGELLVNRQSLISAELIVAVAELFRPSAVELEAIAAEALA